MIRRPPASPATPPGRPSPQRKPVGKGAADGGGPMNGMWIISFADLTSLMLAFFMLMFAMREPDPVRWRDMTGLTTAPSTSSRPALPGDPTPEPRAAFNAEATEEVSARSLDYLSAVLRNQMTTRPALGGLTVARQDDRLVLFAPDALLFAPDGFTLTPRGREALYLLAPLLERAGNRVDVLARVSMTDDPATDGGRAWERALTRAVLTAQGLRDAGYQVDLAARGGVADITIDGEAGVELTIREQKAAPSTPVRPATDLR